MPPRVLRGSSMQKTVSAVALVRLTYKGQVYSYGETLMMDPIDALTYARRQRVSLTKHLRLSSPTKPKRTRGSYRRNDMTADRT